VDCWNVLGVEPDADERAIKLAYSKRLKTTRPEDDSEGFQQLRDAYKTALAAVEAGLAEEAVGDPQQSKVKIPCIPPDTHTQPAVDESSLVISRSEKELSDLIDRISTLMQQPEKVCQKSEWAAVLSLPVMVDLQYRKTASDRIFCMIADALLSGSRESVVTIDKSVLHYLSDEFKWERAHADLLFRFGGRRVDAIFDVLDLERIDWSIRLAGTVGSLLGICMILFGYFGLPIVPVVLMMAIPGTAKRLYTRRWFESRYGISNGGDSEFLNKNKPAEVLLVYCAVCIVELLFYCVGWLARVMTG